MDNIPRGIALTLASIVFFVILDSMAKIMTQTLPSLQIAWGRYVFSVMLLFFLISPRSLIPALRTKRLDLQMARSVLLVSVTCAFFIAIRHVPLADAIAIGFAAPFITCMLAIPVLGEKVGLRRWSAIIVGFAGVMIVLRPGFEERHWAYFLPLGVAAGMAAYNVLTRLVNRYDEARTSMAYNNVAGSAIMSLAVLVLPGQWTTPGAIDWLMLVLLGGCAMTGHYCLIHAFRHAPVSTLAPFTYSHMVLAMIAGLVVFDEVPDAWTLAGVGVIAASGLYIFHRETTLRARASRQAKA